MELSQLIQDWTHALDKKNDPINKRTLYHKKYKPKCNIFDYIVTVSRFLLNSEPFYIRQSLYYLAKYVYNKEIKLNIFNTQRLFLMSCVAVHKFWIDDCYENGYIAESDNIPLKMFNKMEGDFMSGINWTLYEKKSIEDADLLFALSSMCPSFIIH